MTEEEKQQELESPAVLLKKLGRQDAEAGLPSRHEEIEEHFRQDYTAGYEAAEREIQEKLEQASRCGHQLFTPR